MNFIIIAFATWRISSLLVQEDGPFDIFVRLRHTVGVEWDSSGEEYSENVIGQIFTCVWCMSMWVSVVLFLLYLFFGQWFVLACWPFALSGLACLIQGVVNK